MEGRSIYPHRSVRSIRLSPYRLTGIVISAAALSIALFQAANWLLAWHQDFCRALLRLAGVPVTAVAALQVLPGFRLVQIPIVAVPPLAQSRRATLLAVGAVLLLLVLIHRFFPLARSFAFFVSALVLVALGVMVWNPSFRIPPESFVALWLRSQAVLWVLLPWLAAFLFLPIEPSLLLGTFWIVLIGSYGLAWSAVRLAFCLGVMHYTGIAFATALWFALGPLSDLVYILVFYSLVVHFAAKRLWGHRRWVLQ